MVMKARRIAEDPGAELADADEMRWQLGLPPAVSTNHPAHIRLTS